MASRGKLFEELTDQVTRSALQSASLTPEDRVLTRQRVEQAIGTAAGQAQRDVVALAHGDSRGPEADRFVDYLNSTYRRQRDQDVARPDAETTPARRLAAELVAMDDRTNTFDPRLTRRAEYYIAHTVTVAAEGEVQKTLDSSSRQAAPVAREAAPAAGNISGARTAPVQRGQSIG